jgi:hypothetical protein
MPALAPVTTATREWASGCAVIGSNPSQPGAGPEVAFLPAVETVITGGANTAV